MSFSHIPVYSLKHFNTFVFLKNESKVCFPSWWKSLKSKYNDHKLLSPKYIYLQMNIVKISYKKSLKIDYNIEDFMGRSMSKY